MSLRLCRPPLVSRSEIHRIGRAAPQPLVAPLGVEERQVVADRGTRLGHAVVSLQIHLLVLQAAPQPLDGHIIAPAALAIHADADAFASVLAAFQRQMPLEKAPDLLPDSDYFYLKTGGCVGILKDWMTRCLEQAILAGKKTFDTDFAKRFAMSNKSLLTIIGEALMGEASLQDVGLECLQALLDPTARPPFPSPRP